MSAISNNTQSVPSKDNFRKIQTIKLNEMFKLAIIDLTTITGTYLADISKDGSDSVFAKTTSSLNKNVFLFPAGLKAISFEEPASVSVVPLQNGAKYIEHQGSIFKNITISGNTGFRPNKKAQKDFVAYRSANRFLSNKATGNTTVSASDFFPKTSANEIDVEEVTGFDDFVTLRNMFRAYWDAKQDVSLAHNTVMVWGSAIDEDYWIVEPTSFRMNRDPSSRFTYNFEITLKTLAKLDVAAMVRPFDAPSSPSGFGKFLQAFKDITTGINRTSALLNANIAAAGSLAESIISTILGPVGALTSALDNVTALINLPKNAISSIVSNITPMIQKLGNIKSQIMSYSDFSAATGINSVISAAKSLSYDLSALNTLKAKATATNNAVTQTSLSPAQTAGSDFSTSHGTRTAIAGVGDSRLGTGSFSAPMSSFGSTGAFQAAISRSDDIYRIALRNLGDAGRWREIVALNKLKAPYISVNGDGVNVLRPGDFILIPSVGSGNDLSPIDVGNARVNGETLADTALGRDLRLRPTQPYGNDRLWDISIGDNGDFEIISGIENMQQAMNILFNTERGELRPHPDYGVSYPVGGKGTLQSIVEFKLYTKANILKDPRVEDITSLNYYVQGNILSINAEIKIKNSTSTITANIGTPI